MSAPTRRSRPAGNRAASEQIVGETGSMSSVPPVLGDRTHPADVVEPDLWWRDGASRALHTLAESGVIFSADALRDDPFSLPNPPHPSQWGGLFMAAHKAGIIKPVGYATSRTPSRHGGITRLWRGNKRGPVVAR